jgi:hypothetical protein
MLEIYLIGAVITALGIAGIFAFFESFTEMHWPKFALAVVLWPISVPIMVVAMVVQAILEWLNSR